ncbi:ABC transporter permease [Microbulbifer variabilis]|uniref:ABC transporter permease n=1 Tax=Microbulbifer variabilis TaxID=266805 RepID=UPI001CFD63C3|nr:ABC transporter permease [Microbulbifer variabilis]
MFKGLWRYRNFVLTAIQNEFRSRFIRSKLGGLWLILNPLSQVAIYALILSNVLAAKLPGITNHYAYSVYLMAGLLAWNLFNEIVMRCLTLFVEQGNLMKKMNFPKVTLPTIVTGSCMLNNVLLSIAMLTLFVILGFEFNFQMLWLVPLTLIVVLFAIGIGMIAGVLNVFLRDIGQVLPILMQVWFWFTPIVYPKSIIPEDYHGLMLLNPMAQIVNAYQNVLVYGRAVNLADLLPIITVSILLAVASLFLFRRASAEMVDVL